MEQIKRVLRPTDVPDTGLLGEARTRRVVVVLCGRVTFAFVNVCALVYVVGRPRLCSLYLRRK